MRKKIIFLSILIILISQSHAEEPAEPLPFPDTRCSVEFYEADITVVLTALAKAYDLNIITADDVKGKVSCSLKDITLSDVFQTIIENAGLTYTVKGNIVRVETLKKKSERLEEMRKAQESKDKAAPLVTVIYNFKYGINPREAIAKEITKGKEIQDLDELAKALGERLSKREGARVTAINRINALVITDIQENVGSILALLKEMDTPSKQVAIEARIMEITSDSARSLGISWSGELRSGDTYTSGSADFPASISGATSGPALFGFMLGQTDMDMLDIQLSALEKEGNVRMLSNPKIITQDNQRAYIESGTEVPYRYATTAAGVVTYTIEFKKAAIQLEVTPHVIDDGVYMDILVAKKEVDWTRSIEGNPPIDTRSITTKVLVKNGDTLVIGGLKKIKEQKMNEGVPWLSKIPIIGWLFKTETKLEEDAELMIFLTPRCL